MRSFEGKLIRIEAPHFVAGIETYMALGRLDYCEKAYPIHRVAPIINYMKGWPVHRIFHYCKRKNWKANYV